MVICTNIDFVTDADIDQLRAAGFVFLVVNIPLRASSLETNYFKVRSNL